VRYCRGIRQSKQNVRFVLFAGGLMWAGEAAIEAFSGFFRRWGSGAFLDIREVTRDPNVKPMILRLRFKKSALGGKAEMSANG
jgi:hypothetical protein